MITRIVIEFELDDLPGFYTGVVYSEHGEIGCVTGETWRGVMDQCAGIASQYEEETRG